jgi:nitrite reductase (cytochrome c-552)
MNDALPSAQQRGWFFYLVSLLVAAGLTAGILALLLNIMQRKEEGQQHFFQVADLDENSVDPEVWGKNFPRQYDTYKRTVDTVRTKHGGSEAINKLEQDPFLKRLYAGYAFSLDFREERGHAYMFTDQVETGRVKLRKQPGACLHCHTSVLVAYRELGDGDVMKGFEKMCAMPFDKAKDLVKHPVACLDCHDPKTIQLRVTRPVFSSASRSWRKATIPCRICRALNGGAKAAARRTTTPTRRRAGRSCEASSALSATWNITSKKKAVC